MKVNIFNKTEKPVTEHIRGVELTVPARSSLSVSEKKARELLRERPDELSLTHLGDYTPDDIQAMEGLRKDELQEACRLLMRGQVVDFQNFRESHATVAASEDAETGADSAAQ